jgi:hypothetical protein
MKESSVLLNERGRIVWLDRTYPVPVGPPEPTRAQTTPHISATLEPSQHFFFSSTQEPQYLYHTSMASLIVLVLLGISCAVSASLPAWVPGPRPLIGSSIDGEQRGVLYVASAAKPMQTMATPSGRPGVVKYPGKTPGPYGRTIIGNNRDFTAPRKAFPKPTATKHPMTCSFNSRNRGAATTLPRTADKAARAGRHGARGLSKKASTNDLHHCPKDDSVASRRHAALHTFFAGKGAARKTYFAIFWGKYTSPVDGKPRIART